jgi:hypothetical protein
MSTTAGSPAAADAAREARAEAPQAPAPAKGKSARAAKAAADWLEFGVESWITDFNSIEFGLYKSSRNRAKSRQFTADMDIFAEVTDNGVRTGLLGYREELWKKSTGMDKRLVMKMFTDGLNWRATMDLMLGRSLQQTVGARGLPVMCYAINTNDDEFVIYLERSANKWPMLPEHFSFFIMHEGKPVFYRLRRDLISLGGDYTLYDQQGDSVGYLDGAVFSVFGRWNGRVRTGIHDKRLLAVLKMFAGSLIFNTACRRHVKSLYADLRAGRLDTKLERQESDLYLNPRRMR